MRRLHVLIYRDFRRYHEARALNSSAHKPTNAFFFSLRDVAVRDNTGIWPSCEVPNARIRGAGGRREAAVENMSRPLRYKVGMQLFVSEEVLMPTRAANRGTYSRST